MGSKNRPKFLPEKPPDFGQNTPPISAKTPPPFWPKYPPDFAKLSPTFLPYPCRTFSPVKEKLNIFYYIFIILNFKSTAPEGCCKDLPKKAREIMFIFVLVLE